MTNRMSRTAWGIDTPTATNWQRQGACLNNPDLFHSLHADDVARAVHLCLAHCTVFGPCHTDTQAQTPIGCVQAGLRWATPPKHPGGPAKRQPNDPGCGPWCRHMREREAAA